MADRWTDADRELVAGVLHQEGCEDPCPGNCANDAAAVLNALADAGWVRMDPNEPHLVEFRRDGWTIQHPVRCRPNLFACELNRVGESLPGPAGPPTDGLGVYECSLDGDGQLVTGGRRDG